MSVWSQFKVPNQRNDSFRFTAGINFSVPGTKGRLRTLIKSQSSWNSRDMDFILENSDAILKSLNIDGVASISQEFSCKNSTNFKHFFPEL